MVIASDLVVRRLREEARTTGSYQQRHELMEKIFPQPYAALKECVATWGLDEQGKQMALAQKYHVVECSILDLFQPLLIYVACPDNKLRVDPLMEMDLLLVAHEPAPSAMLFKVSKPNGTHLHFVDLTNPGEVPSERGGEMIALYRDVFCTCGFNVMIGPGFRHYQAVVKDSFLAGFHLGLIHAQYSLQDPPVHVNYPLMQRFALVRPLFRNMKCLRRLFPGREEHIFSHGETGLQKLWYQVQIKALCREFEDIAVSVCSARGAEMHTSLKSPLRPEGS